MTHHVRFVVRLLAISAMSLYACSSLAQQCVRMIPSPQIGMSALYNNCDRCMVAAVRYCLEGVKNFTVQAYSEYRYPGCIGNELLVGEHPCSKSSEAQAKPKLPEAQK